MNLTLIAHNGANIVDVIELANESPANEGDNWHKALRQMARLANLWIDCGESRGWAVLAALAICNGLPSFNVRAERAT